MLVDHTTESSTFSDVASSETVISEKANTVNTLNREEIIKIKEELQRWLSILTPEYTRWQVGGYVDSFLLTTERVKTKEDE